MGRTYAGILGPLAMVLILVRGLGQGAGVEATLATAAMAVFLMGAVGYVLGELAAWIVEDSVRNKVATEIANLAAAQEKKKGK